MDLFKSWLVEDYIAHRGLHNKEFPENSIPAFENAIKNGYPIELDVQLLKDDTVIVFHDSSLSRMTGQDGYIENLTKEELSNYKLNSTGYTIPTLEEVLKFVNGRTPLLIEIKNSGKVGKLESETYNLLKKYQGEYAIQSFNPYVLSWFKQNAPEVLRGQLAKSSYKNDNLSLIKRIVLKNMLLNKKVSCPHFIAYEAKALPSRIVRRFKKLPLIAWTIRSQEEYIKTIKYCDNIIFENFEPKI